MTTFTMQDLTPNAIETPEEKEAMDAIQNQVENTSTTNTDNIIQGATGAQYRAVDTKLFEGQANNELLQMILQLNQTMQSILLHIAHTAQKQPVSSSAGGDLAEAVGTVLEQAEWFNDRLNDTINSAIEDKDFGDEIQTAVDSEIENYFSYNFSLEDHVDVHDYVRDAMDDKLEDIVEDKIKELLEEKLSTATISFN
jgi:hypothetical protein